MACLGGLVAWLITDPYNLRRNHAISVGCFIFDFASLSLEVIQPTTLCPKVSVKHQSPIIRHPFQMLLDTLKFDYRDYDNKDDR